MAGTVQAAGCATLASCQGQRSNLVAHGQGVRASKAIKLLRRRHSQLLRAGKAPFDQLHQQGVLHCFCVTKQLQLELSRLPRTSFV